MGGAFGGYANDRIARLAQEAYPAQEPPAIFGGPRPGKTSEGRPQTVVIVVIVVISLGLVTSMAPTLLYIYKVW